MSTSSSSAAAALHALETALIKNPRDLATCSVYADHLQERGDPLGAALALHVAILEDGITAARQTELKILLRTKLEAAELWGDDLASRREELELAFHLAVLERVRALPRRTRAWLPSAELLGLVLTRSIAQLVSKIVLPRYAFNEFAGERLGDLVKRGHLRHVRALEVESAIDSSRGAKKEGRTIQTFDLAPLSVLGPTLEYLDLTGFYRVNADGLSLPNVVTLRIGELDIKKADLDALAVALPRAERLALTLTREKQLAKLKPLSQMKSLHILRLRGTFAAPLDAALLDVKRSLPNVTTIEADDITRNTTSALQEKHPSLKLVRRSAVQPD